MNMPKELTDILSSGDFVLFLGAGYSRDCGLPLWGNALHSLAAEVRKSDATRAALIDQDASRGRFLEAAETFYMAEADKATRFAILRLVFDPTFEPTRRQKKIAALACQAFVTTNFDRVLPSAFAKIKHNVIQYTESANDLHAARLCGEKFSLRLHGRIESPDSLVLSKSHYTHLPQNEAYVEFFRDMFLNRNVIFFGFSFSDPFITHVIQALSRAANSVFRRKAFALMSAAPEAATKAILDEAAIRLVLYDPAEQHRAGWDALTEQPRGVVPVSVEVEKIDTLKREMAAIYARVKSRDFSAERIQVLAGLSLPVVAKSAIGSTLSLDQWIKAVRSELALPSRIAEREIKEAAVVLERDGFIRIGADSISIVVHPQNSGVNEHLDKLVDGVVSRSSVRYHYELPLGVRTLLRDLIGTVVAIDGLHVAHSVLRHSPLKEERLGETIDRALKVTPCPAGVNIQAVISSISHLLTHPDKEEEKLLGQLSSVAFSTSLLIEDPSAAFNYDQSKTLGVFLDTNILLPWLCKGHPLTELYGGIVEAFGYSRVFVIPEYANEMVSHRRLAIQSFHDAKLEDPDRLQRYVTLFEAHGVNTFIGGYAGVVAGGYQGSFDDYLREFAPFETDSEAMAFLESRGIKRVDFSFAERQRCREGALLPSLRAAMKDRRSEIVIEHDALQIFKLIQLHARGERLHFVTADKLLLASMSQTEARALLPYVWLPYHAVYLAQLQGAPVKPGLARALWASSQEFSSRVQEYYIDRVLKQYETALVRSLPDIVESTMDEISRLESRIGSLEDSEIGADARVKAFLSLDRFEEGFYRKMQEAMKRADR